MAHLPKLLRPFYSVFQGPTTSLRTGINLALKLESKKQCFHRLPFQSLLGDREGEELVGLELPSAEIPDSQFTTIPLVVSRFQESQASLLVYLELHYVGAKEWTGRKSWSGCKSWTTEGLSKKPEAVGLRSKSLKQFISPGFLSRA